MKIGRNEKCPCGSGKKYKKCCLAKDAAAVVEARWRFTPPSANRWVEDDHDTRVCSECGSTGHVPVHPYEVLLSGERRKKLPPDRLAPSVVEKLGTDVLLKQLAMTGIEITPESFLASCRGRTSAWSISDDWFATLEMDMTAKARDFYGLAACELWKRLCAGRPSQEMLLDWIEEGYALIHEGDRKKGYARWWQAWNVLRPRIDREMSTFEKARAVFEPGALKGWLVDFSDDLYEEALGDRREAPRAVELIEQILAAFPGLAEEDDDLAYGLRAQLGEMLFMIGRADEGAPALLELIRTHPRKALAYTCLADALEQKGELRRALDVLEQAKKADFDEDRDDEVQFFAERAAEIEERLRDESSCPGPSPR